MTDLLNTLNVLKHSERQAPQEKAGVFVSYYFVTRSNKLSGLKQHKSIILIFWSSNI